MAAERPSVCSYCAALFPDEWPRDDVLDARELGPVDAARQLVVFERILHAARLPDRHLGCLAESLDWLWRLRAAARQLRVVGVEPEKYVLWRRQLRAAHDAVARELDGRSRWRNETA